MPLEWLTNYEHFHQNSEPVQTTEATFDRRPNGQVKLSFQTPNTKPVSDNPQLSYTAMITAVQTGQEKKLPIHGFSSEGYPVYPDKINGPFYGMFLKPICAIQIVLAWTTQMLMMN